MFKLFGKKKPAAPEDRLAFCRDKRDWAGLARACYELGVSAMERGEPNRAQLWLHRADTIYSAKDEVYEAVGEKLADDCSARIGQLEEAHILYNNLPSQVEEKAESLGDAKVRLWGLLSLSRLPFWENGWRPFPAARLWETWAGRRTQCWRVSGLLLAMRSSSVSRS